MNIIMILAPYIYFKNEMHFKQEIFYMWERRDTLFGFKIMKKKMKYSELGMMVSLPFKDVQRLK